MPDVRQAGFPCALNTNRAPDHTRRGIAVFLWREAASAPSLTLTACRSRDGLTLE